MDIVIGLAVLGLVVWSIYKMFCDENTDINKDGKVDAEDAKVGMDMAVGAVGGMATGAAVAAANIVEEKIDKAREEVKANIDAKTEEVFVKVMEEAAKAETAVVEEAKEAAAELVKEVDQVVEEVKVQELKVGKKGRKPKVK
jgi:hypothetical protein